VKQFPPIPRVTDAPPELFERGHLWVLELIDGVHLRFQLQQSGRIRFGDRTRVYDDSDELPEPYQHAVSHVQRQLDREALRRAVADVESVVFFAEATVRSGIEYDWGQIPPVLGFDIWSDAEGSFRPPGAVNRIFERLGLQPVNAVARELPTRDFDVESYSIPQSAWYDGPAAGVVIRNDRGQRAKLLNPDRDTTAEPTPVDASPAELADRYATTARFEKLAVDCEPVTFQRLYDRVLEDISRERPMLYDSGTDVDIGAFRSAVAERTQAFLDNQYRD